MKIKATICFLALFIFFGVATKATTTLEIRGVVTELGSGNPIADANVIIESTLSNGDFFRNYILTDSDGKYNNVLNILKDFTDGKSLISITDCFGNSVDTTIFFSSASSSHECNFNICHVVPTTCIADFTYSIDENSPLTVHFENQSSGSTPFYYHWTFDGIDHSLIENPSHTFPSPGVYQVCLDVYSQSNGCTDQKCIPIIVTNSDCKALFNTTIDDLSVTAFGETEWEGGDVVYYWDFDGTNYTGQIANHTFAQAGRYLVTLTTQNEDSCIGYYETIVSVGNFHTVDADFSFVTDPEDPYRFFFTNNSAKNDYSYVWTFGDGGTSFAENPEHYYGDGTFLVTLLIYDQGDILSSYSSFIVAPDYGCFSDFSIERFGLDIHFIGETTSLEETTYQWDMDGLAQIEGAEVNFVFPENGTYFITLHTTDLDGCSFEITKEFYFYECFSSFNYSNEAFLYSFTGETNSIYPTNYSWEIGENITLSGKEISYIFPENGNYNVKLIATDDEGCVDSITQQIIVDYEGSCQAAYQWKADTIDNQIFYQFTNISSGVYDSIEWSFGDGNISYDENPLHLFENSQDYDVTLSLWNRDPQYFTHSTHSIQIAVSNGTYYDFGGQIYGGYFPINQSEVMLYLKNGNNIQYVSTSNVNDDGIYYFYQVLAGDYLLRSRPIYSTLEEEDFVNTYVGDEIFWKEATPTTLENNNWNNDIVLQQNPKLTELGNGSIEGFVESNSNHEAIPDIDILLFNNNYQLLDATRSDENGLFSFLDIAYGNYIVYPEVTGKITYPYHATLSEENPNITDIGFGIDDNYVVLGIEEIGNAQFSVVPNPATDNIVVHGEDLRGSKAQIVISDLAGRTVLRFAEKRFNSKENLDISSLASGTYIIEVKTITGSYQQKFLKR